MVIFFTMTKRRLTRGAAGLARVFACPAWGTA